MFPITITLHNNDQLSAVLAALATAPAPIPSEKPAKPSKTNPPAQATVATNGASSTPEALPSPADAAAQKPAAGAATPPAAESEVAGGKTGQQAVEALDNSAKLAADTPSYDEVKAAVLGLVKSKGREAAVGVLKSFGLESAQAAKPEQYAAILAAVKKAGE